MTTPWRQHDDPRLGSGRHFGAGSAWKAWAFLWPVVCYVLIAAPPRAFAQGDHEGEYQVKLVFLYNFAEFVQWPADTFRDAGAPLTICVAGDNPFQGEIEQSLRGRTVGGHPLEVRRLNSDEDPHACQMIFVRATEMKATSRILASSKGSSTLTVGEAKGFAERGGILNLTREENKLRFEVNIDAAAQTRLKISSKLLALAKIVKE
jgi:hypothetical protein